MQNFISPKAARNIMLALIFSLAACEGDPGPSGPQGVSGPEGPQGPKGDNGVGASTIIFDVLPQSWAGDTNGYYATLEIPEITNDIYEKGALLVYSLNNEGTTNKSFNMLPYTYIDGSSFEYLDYEAYVGRLVVSLKWVDDGVNSTKAPTQNYAFKIVIVEGIFISDIKNNVDIGSPLQTINYLQKVAFVKQLQNRKTSF